MQALHLLPLGLMAVCALTTADDDGSPPEFGDVKWGRTLEPALGRSAASHKPVMLFFQEVPG